MRLAGFPVAGICVTRWPESRATPVVCTKDDGATARGCQLGSGGERMSVLPASYALGGKVLDSSGIYT